MRRNAFAEGSTEGRGRLQVGDSLTALHLRVKHNMTEENLNSDPDVMRSEHDEMHATGKADHSHTKPPQGQLNLRYGGAE